MVKKYGSRSRKKWWSRSVLFAKIEGMPSHPATIFQRDRLFEIVLSDAPTKRRYIHMRLTSAIGIKDVEPN
jgi:hypothetical protein